MTDRHHTLNSICTLCGEYGTVLCATCPVEQSRQQEVLNRMKVDVSGEEQLQMQSNSEPYSWMVSA